MFRIGITGPESTGKTSLAQALSEKYACPWVSEYAREYLQNKTEYTEQDLVRIAEEQWKRMQANDSKKPYVFYDTEMTVIKIWYEFKYGKSNPYINQHYQNQQLDIYLLCDIDIPWAFDPMREHPNQREELKNLYMEELTRMNRPFYLLSGDINQRISQVEEILTGL